MTEVARKPVDQRFAERLIGHGLAAALALAALAAGIAALVADMPPVLGVANLLVGVIMLPLVWKSLHRSRAAWAFLIAFASVFGVVCLFGAPKIRTLLGINLGAALVIPVFQIACVVCLSLLRHEYRE